MSIEKVSRGESYEITVLDRAFGGKETVAFRVSGGGLNTATGLTENIGDMLITPPSGAALKLNGSSIASSGNMFFTAAAGVASAGPVTLAGTKVGDKVVGVVDITTAATPTNAAANFESTITVAGQIQQSSASDLHLHGFTFLIVHV